MMRSLRKMAETGIKMAATEFLKVAPPKMAIAATAVTFGQCGIKRDMATANTVIKIIETFGFIFESIIITFWQM